MIHERIDPNLDENIMRLSRFAHIKRYQKAKEIIGTEKAVLDAGCGYGYGSNILSEGNVVVGIDISQEAIEYAKSHYGNNNITYSQEDLTNANLEEYGTFDIITHFEVMEHLEDPLFSLERMRKVLKDSGKLIISVPNGNNSPDNNDHHLNNYSPEDLEKILMKGGFSVKQRFGQYPLLGFMADLIKKVTGYESCTDKESGIIPKLIDSIPFLPNLFSNIYESRFAVSTGRTIYFVADKV